MTTVVTAYYEIKSKFHTDQYWEWINNFCTIPCNLIIFTTENLIEKFNDLRKDFSNTKIISLPFEELYHYKFKNIYEEHLAIDFHKNIHSSDLYIIWAEKVKFVMRAIELNPFNTNKFIWCDIGVVRHPEYLPIYRSFPQTEKIENGKMTFLMLRDFLFHERVASPITKGGDGISGQIYSPGMVRLGGGIQGGDIDSWKEYNKLWDSTLQRYFAANRFAGQDQCIMGTIYLEHSDLFHIVNAPYINGDLEWFYLLFHWSLINIQFTI